MAIEAGHLMLKRIADLLDNRKSFSIETTLATKSYSKMIADAKEQGYEVILLFFWLDEVELAIERVAKRVREGGHNIPESVIRRRYELGLKNLFRIFLPIVDGWWLVDNSHGLNKIIATEKGVVDIERFDKIKCYVG